MHKFKYRFFLVSVHLYFPLAAGCQYGYTPSLKHGSYLKSKTKLSLTQNCAGIKNQNFADIGICHLINHILISRRSNRGKRQIDNFPILLRTLTLLRLPFI